MSEPHKPTKQTNKQMVPSVNLIVEMEALFEQSVGVLYWWKMYTLSKNTAKILNSSLLRKNEI